MWHVVPLIVITVLAEIVRGMTNYSWSGDVAGTVLMSFSSFGYYGQIWFNRAYTYECAVEEMPAGYGDTLMSVSPAWRYADVGQSCMGISGCCHRRYDLVGMDCKYFHEDAQSC